MRLVTLTDELAVARLEPHTPTPDWAWKGTVSSVTRTPEELSVVCAAESVPPGVKAEAGWRCLRVAGRLDFSLTGVLAAIAVPLAAGKVSMFAISTYDTDYVLVRGESLATAIECLTAAGHDVVDV